MGSSTASALLRSDPRLDIALASRSRRTYEAAVKKRPELANTRVGHHSHLICAAYHKNYLTWAVQAACPTTN